MYSCCEFSKQSSLLENGIAVLPFPSEIRDNFNLHKFLHEQKEFKNSDDNTLFVLGGFGALGNPSSFHHPEVRKLRLSIFYQMKEVFRKLYPNRYLEGIVDRFCIRNPGASISGESWHRDNSKMSKDEVRYGDNDDIIYGGWVNLDQNNTQYFLCVPNTHKESNNHAGFARLSKEESNAYKQLSCNIPIPPGHLIIFNENTVHKIAPYKITTKSYRLFMKYRISNTNKPFFNNIQSIIDNQGVFPISYAQIPPLYGKLHWVNWRPRLIEFSKNLHPQFLETKKTPTGEDIIIVKRFMPSLKEANIELFPDYSAEEIAMLQPQLLLLSQTPKQQQIPEIIDHSNEYISSRKKRSQSIEQKQSQKRGRIE